MANAENLIPLSERTKSEQREIQSAGGTASGKSRRRKKAMKQAVSTLLNMSASENSTGFAASVRKRLTEFGVKGDDLTYQDALLAGILLEAMNGDVRAAEFIRDTAGENPALEIRKQELKLRKEELRFKQELERQKAGDALPGEEPREDDLSRSLRELGEELKSDD